MHSLEIILETEYSATPAHIKISIDNKEIFNGLIKSKQKYISHDLSLEDRIDIKISKTGKSKDIVDAGHTQQTTIKSITLNGIDLKIDAFGVFHVKDNVYVTDKELQTTTLTLNGEWCLSIPSTYKLPGHLTREGEIIRKKFTSSDIACFGASNTYRGGFQCWPHYLANLSNRNVQNYGLPGSSWPEITRLVEEYSRLVKASDLVILSPHCFRFQIQDEVGGKWVNSGDWDLLKRQVVLHGAEHYVAVLSANLCEFFDRISKSHNIYICPDNQEEYHLFHKTPLKKYLISDVDFPDDQLADDGGHWGKKWNETFAGKTVRHMGILKQ